VFPILIDLGTHDLPVLGETHLFLPTYGVLFAIAVLIAWWWYIRRARTLDLAEDLLFNQIFYALLAGIIGAKLALILVDWRSYLAHPGEILGTLRSAGVLMGGVIAGALVFTWYARRHDMPLHRLGDAIAAPLVLAQGIGRLGCLSAGCCWGRPLDADHPLAIVFTDPRAREQTGVPLGSPLAPTQIIELSYDLLLALLLTRLWRARLAPDGTVFWIYVLAYSAGRLIIELWRGDVHRGLYFGGLLSTSQLIAMGGIALGSVMLLLGRRRRRKASSA
jgi:phosphatidylglycerol:prolipoprotein diacylglycerol transferase